MGSEYGFRLRKTIHFSLLFSILLIQAIIIGYFYNDFSNRKKISLLEDQLKDIQTLEDLTVRSNQELMDAQNNLHQYYITKDKKFLDDYFKSFNSFSHNFDQINAYSSKNPDFKKTLDSRKNDSVQIKTLKTLIDSTYSYSVKNNINTINKIPDFKKYRLDNNFKKFDIQSHTISDSVKKKGLFGRLKDAFAGRETVRKESTIITIKEKELEDADKLKAELDSIINTIDNHYKREIKNVQVKLIKNNEETDHFFRIFNRLMTYSNNLMNVYQYTIRDSKQQLQNELIAQNSMSQKIRTFLVFGAMGLMFIVSLLLMYLTRMAFVYESRLNKANRQIQENLNFKNRILGMLSHELRSPLKIVGIFINRIKKKTNDENIQDYLKSISYTNETLLVQANQILEYTKNQHKKAELQPRVFNLKEEVDAIFGSIRPYVETRNNQFTVQDNIDPNLIVNTDNAKINQLFMNIISNANKFTENGEIKVEVNTKKINDNKLFFEAIIADTGVGITKEDLKKIFEPYYQGVISEEVENLGAGLGLNLCKEIVELFSGKIFIDSEIGKGTTVVFRLNLDIYNEGK